MFPKISQTWRRPLVKCTPNHFHIFLEIRQGKNLRSQNRPSKTTYKGLLCDYEPSCGPSLEALEGKLSVKWAGDLWYICQ